MQTWGRAFSSALRNECALSRLWTLRPLAVARTWGSAVPSQQYYLKQAQLAAQLALAESDPEKAQALHLLALDYFDKAEKAKAEEPQAKCG